MRCKTVLKRHFVSAFALLTLLCAPASAQVVYDNGGPDNVTAFFSDSSAEGYTAESFTLASTATFNTVTWFGVYAPTQTPTVSDNFTLLFYDTTGGSPNATARLGETFVIGSSVTRTTTDITSPLTIYRYSATLPSALTYTAGTYGISIVNDTTDAIDQNFWAWSTSSQTGSIFIRMSPTDSFTELEDANLAFNLSNVGAQTAPEPGSLALLALGTTVGVVMVQQRRRPRKTLSFAHRVVDRLHH